MAQGLIEQWPDVDPATVAPLREGKPDMLNHQATRFVSLIEAKARGWKHFWTGARCNYGHRAARYVSNASICTDCERVKKGQLPVYTNAAPELDAPRGRRSGPPPRVAAAPAGPPQPSAAERLFLTKYAELKDFVKAAEACGRSEAEFMAILSWNTVFREAVNRLEEDMGIARTQELSEHFEWNDAKRRAFLHVYSNTADMKQALRSIGVTNLQFHTELAENAEFADGFEKAQRIASAIFDHAAGALAAKGDSRMLGRVAANLFPEKYGENLKMDLNVTQQMKPEQLNAALTQALGRLDRAGVLNRRDPVVVDAEFSDSTDVRQIEGPGAGESQAPDDGSDPNSDLVSGPDGPSDPES